MHLGIYVRLSRENEDSSSIDNQIREAKAFAEREGFIPSQIRIYNEQEGLSGGLTEQFRPELEKLMNDMRRGVITHLYTRKQDRLERNPMLWGSFLTIVLDKSIKVYYSGVLQDFDTAEGKMIANIISSTNKYALDKQSFLTKRALHDNMKEVKHRGGHLPYGYTTDENRYVIIDEDEAEIVERIFRMCNSGLGSRAIATILEDEGIKTRFQKLGTGTRKVTNKYTGKVTLNLKSDCQWAQNTIVSIIKNECYIGRKYLGKGNEREVYEYPRLLADRIWEQANDQLLSNRRKSGKRVTHRYLLKGILECGLCFRNYYGKINKTTELYICSSKRLGKLKNCGNRGIRIPHVENYIWERLFLQKDIMTPIREHLDNRHKEDSIRELEELLTDFGKEIEEITTKKKRAVRLAINGILSESDISEEMDMLDRESRQLNIHIDNANSQMELYRNAQVYEQQLIKDLRGIKKAKFSKKKYLVGKYIDRITVNYEKEIGFTLGINYSFGHTVYHILETKGRIGLDLNSLESYRIGDTTEEEAAKCYLKMIEGLKEFTRDEE